MIVFVCFESKACVHDVCFSPSGHALASASDDHTIRIWEPTVRGHSIVIKAHSGPVTSVCYSTDGKLLLSASHDKTCKVFFVFVFVLFLLFFCLFCFVFFLFIASFSRIQPTPIA